MAADDRTSNEPDPSSVERNVSSFLEHLQTPIKQAQEWVSAGQLQSTIEQLQAQAERAPERMRRGLRALNEVRRGVETHVKRQWDVYRREGAQPTESESEPQPEAEESAVIETEAPSVHIVSSQESGTGEATKPDAGSSNATNASRKGKRRSSGKNRGRKRTTEGTP